MNAELKFTKKFFLKLHQDAITQRVELIKEVQELNREGGSQTVFNAAKYDALTLQEIREIIQGNESVSDMASRIKFHLDAIQKLKEPITLGV